MIEIRNISKTYYPEKSSPIPALKNVDLVLHNGEFVAIVGASGSGKSTLLNTLGGLDKPDSGEVYINKTPMSTFDGDQFSDYRKDYVGFVFQHFHLMPHLTVLENVELALAMSSYEKNEAHQKCVQAIQEVGLEKVIHHKAGELSGGQQQRVAIARALVKSPKMILADEPTGALDSQTSQEIIDLLNKISGQGRLVVVVTHDESVANQASRIIRVKDGEIIEDLKQSSSDFVQTAETAEPPRKRSFQLKSAFRLSYHRIKEKKWRYFLVSIGISMGICGFFLALAFGNGIDNYMQYSSDKVIDSKKLEFTKEQDYMLSSDYYEMKKNKHVKLVQPEFDISARIEKKPDIISFDVKPLHKEKNRSEYAAPNVMYGQLPKDEEHGIALSESTAQKLLQDGEKLEDLIGKEITIKFQSMDEITSYPSRWDTQTMKISAITERSFIGKEYSYIPYDVHTDVVKRSRFIGKDSEITNNSYGVYLDDKSSIQSVVDQFKQSYTITTPENVLKELTQTFKNIQLAMTGVSILILLISSIMVGIILFISVLERRKEIGLFKAIGGRKREVRWIFFSEAILLGGMASINGTVLGVVVQLVVNQTLEPKIHFQLMSLNVFTILISIGFGILINVVAGTIPANQAAKLNPIQLLKQE
ncbi:ATP-binding cassette domain-containing protein [Paenibacillus pseudetheri]|uniref:Macrolide export ATP-binding/permease protein MacB n=1 Tax=Paenibacillus pseudetheri TaxID=2897682 RepID=A0ABM9BAC3_9BACL|nr:ABC transporter ATP-binding protein/permease [Paenibacillus pseudetheri]CAH1055637.1 Macrolide export ATP-binding/permease protein MacB [Paenibacillus pseudetheri]